MGKRLTKEKEAEFEELYKQMDQTQRRQMLELAVSLAFKDKPAGTKAEQYPKCKPGSFYGLGLE